MQKEKSKKSQKIDIKTGKINVQTENIFPIIKKFLYSDHEIFLRELISNAVDATNKIKSLSSMGDIKEELGDLTIDVVLDKENKTISVKDRGIGMTADEVDKYINQIAFSGAEEFIKKHKGKNDNDISQLIGHFGLGFYSSFMVSKKVEIITKTYKKGPGSKSVKWECDGSPEYTLTEIDKNDRGTEIILHISDDSIEFLEEQRILDLLKKYCKFLPIPIHFGSEKKWEKSEGEKDENGEDKYIEIEKPRIINNINPAWKIKPTELTDKDYNSFYKELYPSLYENPLFNIHLNVDYPFNLTGILYFPKVKRNFEAQKEKIQLYSNQVFVTNSVEDIVPEFLTLMHGVIDSPDIPLNVSRSYLQSDSNVKKISSHIMKKVADKLEDIFKNNREELEKKWDDIKIFIEYGMISEPKFYDRAEKFCLLKDTKGNFYTLEEYKNYIKDNQTNKDGKIVFLYTNDILEQHSFIENAIGKEYNILIMDGPLDNHFINVIEQKLENTIFARVDADVIDKLIQKEDYVISKITEDEQKNLKTLFEEILKDENYSVVFENLSETELPIQITKPEFMRRMRDMSMIGGMSHMNNFPDSINVVVNNNHELITKICSNITEEERKSIAKQLIDIAKLSQNLLKGEDLTEFIKRSINLI